MRRVDWPDAAHEQHRDEHVRRVARQGSGSASAGRCLDDVGHERAAIHPSRSTVTNARPLIGVLTSIGRGLARACILHAVRHQLRLPRVAVAPFCFLVAERAETSCSSTPAARWVSCAVSSRKYSPGSVGTRLPTTGATCAGVRPRHRQSASERGWFPLLAELADTPVVVHFHGADRACRRGLLS